MTEQRGTTTGSRSGRAALAAAIALVLVAGVGAVIVDRTQHPAGSDAGARPVSGAPRLPVVDVAPVTTPTPVRHHRAAHRNAPHSSRTPPVESTTPAVRHHVHVTPTPTRVVRDHTIAPHSDLSQVPQRTLLATLHGKTPGYSTSAADNQSMVVPHGWYGRTSVLPVLALTKTRAKVRLARRPNEATTWVDRDQVTFSYTAYAILIDISARRLYVFRHGVQKKSFPVGVGVPSTPTPTGTYFLAFHAPPNTPAYGPVMLETSAHSTAFTTFEGGNDAIIAIHGPIGSDAAIGTQGAAISNGCIRMHNSQLVKVAHAPDGTPIVFVH